MIDRTALTPALAKFVVSLEDDLRARSAEVESVGEVVRSEWEAARAVGRTDHALEVWAEGLFTQVAVGWVLASVFVRFCEDNGLITEPLISGPGDRRRRAEDAQTLFFRERPEAGEREFLEHVFTQAAGLPGLSFVLGTHNPVWQFGPTSDACRDLLALWRAQDPETGELTWDFTDPDWDTRFLGDLYQDLSEAAKKNFALLQTPDFVEEFILDRTLDPAVEEFGLDGFRMIDPACGSGHFLLGSFDRVFNRWVEREPATERRALAARALGSVFGVDINPFAVAIARFRLLVAALKASNVRTLREAPNFEVNVATGDSLYHGPPPGQLPTLLAQVEAQDDAMAHVFATEDGEMVTAILSERYHAVVANPPYITPKDPAANAAYRIRYKTCHRQYALTVPFMERLFDLAVRGGPSTLAGFVGQITGNSFMKREFGKKVIEEFLASEVELTHVIDTSGAYIPGHGTPTVVLFGRNRRSTGADVRMVLGIRGEPARPADPSKGLVWSEIVRLIDSPGSEGEFVSVSNASPGVLRAHPWSVQGGSAQDLKARMSAASTPLEEAITEIGFGVVTREDDVFRVGTGASARLGVPAVYTLPLVAGEEVRDWSFRSLTGAIWPYEHRTLDATAEGGVVAALWPWRTQLSVRVAFGLSQLQRGLRWWEYSMFFRERYRSALAISFSSVATHNHFLLDHGGKVFNRTAPVMKLSAGATVDDHLKLLGPLNSSAGCFWMKQVFYNKGNGGVGGGIGDEDWEPRYALDGTKLQQFPVPPGSAVAWASALDSMAHYLTELRPESQIAAHRDRASALVDARRAAGEVRRRMVAVQEELDWRCYFLYGVTDEDLSLAPNDAPVIDRGERAFEIALARRMAAGEVESSWFVRHGSTPITELPAQWPEDYKALVERRLDLIESDRFVSLLERPEYKRRWNWDSWQELERRALRDWLLDRLESDALWSAGVPRSVAQIADMVRTDAEFVEVAELYVGSPDIDFADLVGRLVSEDAVPFLAALRYTDSGLRKRAQWEATWDLQRREDAGEDVGKIPVPPKYGNGDFRHKTFWSLRGKLDVPKERFVSYPGLGRDTDPTLLIGWAGWDHLGQAKALAHVYQDRRRVDGWSGDQVVPVLAGLAELVPWLVQWHNDVDVASGQRLGDFFNQFVTAECEALGIPRSDLGAWRPPAPTRGRRKQS